MRPSPGLAKAQRRWMSDGGTIWRKIETSDGMGGSTVAWAEQSTTPVQLAPPSASERQSAAQEGVELTHILTVPSATDLVRGDRVIVDGTTVEVVAVEVGTHSVSLRARGREEPWDEQTS